MNILMVSEFFPDLKDVKFLGGVEAREYFVAKYLAKKHNVTVLAAFIEGKRIETLGNLTVVRIGQKRSYRAVTGNVWERLKFIREAIREGKSLDADLVDGCNFIAHFVALRISKTKKIPSVAWYPEVWRGEWVKNSGLVGITGEMLERFNLWQGFDCFIVISEETAKRLRKYTNKKVNVIPCGVEKSEFKGKVKKFKNPTLISIGRLSVNKNHQVVIKAVSRLKSDVKLIIIGSGPEKANLKKLARDLGMSKRIEFLENLPRKKIIKLLMSSYIFCLPSKLEGFGISTIEAAASGLPFVISKIPVHKEVTKNGQGGFLVDADDFNEMAEKIELLLRNKTLYNKKSKEALALSQNYDWEKIAKQTEEIYKTLI